MIEFMLVALIVVAFVAVFGYLAIKGFSFLIAFLVALTWIVFFVVLFPLWIPYSIYLENTGPRLAYIRKTDRKLSVTLKHMTRFYFRLLFWRRPFLT